MTIAGLSIEQRLEIHTVYEPMSGCHLWTGAAHELGYGRIRINGKTLPAHRVAYELKKGEIPKGYHLDHLCLTPQCINPEHLEAVTPSVNVKRMLVRVLAKKTHCAQGHPWIPENIYRRKSNGWAFCKVCHWPKPKGDKNAVG
jgi:hypothetical protein